MANGVYNRAKYLLADGTLDLPTTADLRVLLVNTGYAFNADHNFVSEVVANEISAAGYARQPLTGETITEDDTNDFAYLDADDTPFPAMASGQTIGGAIVYKFNAADASAEVIAFYDLTDTATNGGTVTVQWAAIASGGVLKVA
jgi:hypothetical protein